MLREIQTTDIPSIINTLLALREESPVYSLGPADTEYVSGTLTKMIGTYGFIGIIDDGRGLIFGMTSPSWYSPEYYAYEQVLYVAPEYRGTGLAIRLIKRFESEARRLLALGVVVGASTGVKEQQTLSMYRRLGYEPFGGAYRKKF